MTKAETYNGWANRETWAFGLHLNNDQGLQAWAIEAAQGVIEDRLSRHDEVHVRAVGEALVEQVQELIAEAEGAEWARLMRDDVGSWWRVDAVEIGQEFAELALENRADEYLVETDGFVRPVETDS